MNSGGTPYEKPAAKCVRSEKKTQLSRYSPGFHMLTNKPDSGFERGARAEDGGDAL